MKQHTVPAEPGSHLVFRNNNLSPVSLVLDYGDFGTATIIVPINGIVSLQIGDRAPILSIHDAPPDIGDPDNIIPMNQDD